LLLSVSPLVIHQLETHAATLSFLAILCDLLAAEVSTKEVCEKNYLKVSGTCIATIFATKQNAGFVSNFKNPVSLLFLPAICGIVVTASFTLSYVRCSETSLLALLSGDRL